MSTLRISNIEAKADSSSPTVDEQLKFTNSDGDLMLYLDGRTAGITTVGINTTNQTIKFDANNNVMITGIVTATEFHGTLAVGTSVTYGDNEKEYFGTDLDMSLYHDGSNAYLSNTTGALNLRNTDGSLIDIMSHASARIRVNAGELAVVCNHNSSVDLYYNNNLKFQTTNTGAVVTGILTATSFSGGSGNSSLDAGILDLKTGGNIRLRFASGGEAQFRGDTNPIASFDRGSANSTNVSWKYLGAARGQVSSTSGEFRLTADGTIPMTFYSNSNEKLRITSSGIIGAGGIPIAASASNGVGNAGTFQFYHVNTSGNNAAAGKIQSIATGAFSGSTSTWDADLVFSSVLNSTETERLRITSAGVVDVTGSIIVDAPTGGASGLAIEGVSGETCGVIKHRNDTQHAIIFRGSSNADGSTITGGNTMEYREYGDHVFKTGPINQSERLRIHASGKVSIGSSETSTGLLLLDKNLTAESDVSDKNNYHLVIRSQTNSNTAKIGIAFADTTNDEHVGAAILHHRETTDSVGSLAFYTSQNPGTTAERFRITRYGEIGLSGANYGTNGQVLTSQGPGQPVTWKTIAQPADISSISGNIFAGSSGQTLTITGQYFETGQGVLNFTQTSDGVNVNVNVTPSSDTSMTVTVPSSVGNNVTAGNAVTIKFTNASGFVGDGANTTVLALPSGGTITTSGNYRIHTFTSSSNLVLTKSVACEYLVVAGGGGGGGNDGGHDFSGGSGGGGAGGYRVGTVTPSASTHTVTVGGGGSGNNSAASGADGSASAFGSITTVGGGGGGGCNNAAENGRAGGSGGGASGDDGSTVFTGGAGTSGQGNAGGQTGGAANAGGGGGGGANGTGGNGVGHQGGNGGDGSVSSITGSAVTRSGGGGGGNGASASQSSGGSGGGGTGAVRSSSDAGAGGTNTGGGGGGAADSNTVSERAGANGGSGIVIVRYDVTNL